MTPLKAEVIVKAGDTVLPNMIDRECEAVEVGMRSSEARLWSMCFLR